MEALCWCYRRLERHRLCIESCDRCLRVDPYNVYANYLKCKYQCWDSEERKKRLRRVIVDRPGFYPAYLDLAYLSLADDKERFILDEVLDTRMMSVNSMAKVAVAYINIFEEKDKARHYLSKAH